MEGAGVGGRERQRCKKEVGKEQEDVPARAHRGRCVDGLCGVVGFCVCFCAAAWFGSACLLAGENVCVSVCGDCAVLCCAVVWLGTERAVLGRRRCAARPYVGHRTQDASRSLLACLLHPYILLANPNSCDVFHCLQRIHNGEGGDEDSYLCLHVCVSL